MILLLAEVGGIFALLTLIHFTVDWIFQTHADAMVKSGNAKIRAKHCLVYTLGFLPFFLILNETPSNIFIYSNILFWSHFAEDTYIPVYLWAKYIRKVPAITEGYIKLDPDEYQGIRVANMEGFKEWVQTPFGAILMIAIDQIIHIWFLLAIAFMLVW